MIRRLAIEHGWPPSHIDVLLRANLGQEGAARAAWQAWRRTRVLEDAEWREIRLLAPLARRVRVLEPDCALLPRLEGMAKLHWTQTQLTLAEIVPALDALNRANIPCLLFKGGADYAEGFAPATRRIMGDVDVLVRPGDVVRATDVLCASGWESSSGESPQYLRALVPVRASTNFRRGRFGDIDLHRVAYHFSKRDTELDAALWSRAREVLFAGKKVLVPSGEDSILISLASGVGGNSGDWAIDVGHRISVCSLDWDRIVDMTLRRGLVPAALSGLTYLRSLGLTVPEAAITRLSALHVPVAEWLKYWSNIRGHGLRRGVAKKVVNRVADLGLPMRTYDYRVRGVEPIPVRRPSIWPRFGWGLLPVAEGAHEWRTNHRLRVGQAGSACMIALCIPADTASRRVFFDVRMGELTLARLRTRSGGGGKRQPVLRFRFPLPVQNGCPVDLTVESRPVRYEDGARPPNPREPLAAVPFRLVGAWLR
ncbi:MAG TPA: nucleotidyltransferase family protein [Burkholderiales bacterium]|nr:nucleotidyltransferase family protein [Burkholderiales bacterium]